MSSALSPAEKQKIVYQILKEHSPYPKNIPESVSIYRYVKANKIRIDEIKTWEDVQIPKIGRRTIISKETEDQIVLELRKAINLGWALTPLQARKYVYEVQKMLEVKKGGRRYRIYPIGSMMNKSAWQRFKIKHGFDKTCKPRTKIPPDPEAVYKFFETLTNVMSETGLEPKDVFNIDESFVEIGKYKSKYFITEEKSKSNRKEDVKQQMMAPPQASCKMCITMCVSWDGKMLPPHLLIAVGSRAKPTGEVNVSSRLYYDLLFAAAAGPKNAIIAFNANGWLNAEILLQVREIWIEASIISF